MRLRIAAAVLLTLTAMACAGRGDADAGSSAREAYVRRMQAKTGVPGEAMDRKRRSEARLKAEGVPVLASLPVIATEAESRRRTAREVAGRAIALVLVATHADGAPPRIQDRLSGEYGAKAYLSPQERRFVETAAPPANEAVQLTWRFEAACTLLWSIGYVDSLPAPSEPCDAQRVLGAVEARGPERFFRDARLRPQAELLDADDITYRYHWAVVDARTAGRQPPDGVDPDIVVERHAALNWLVGYLDQEWDDVTTDT